MSATTYTPPADGPRTCAGCLDAFPSLDALRRHWRGACRAVRADVRTLERDASPLGVFWRALGDGQRVSRAAVLAGYREAPPPMPDEVKAVLRERAAQRRAVRASLRARTSGRRR